MVVLHVRNGLGSSSSGEAPGGSFLLFVVARELDSTDGSNLG
jgi:hypothetical protein